MLIASHHLVQDVHDWLVLLHSQRLLRVSFCLIPAYVDINGSEQADTATKEAAEFDNFQCIDIPQRLHEYHPLPYQK